MKKTTQSATEQANGKKDLYEIMWKKMQQQGWQTIRHFTEGSHVPFSVETTRRMFSKCDYKNIAPATVAIIAKYLGFTPQEIRDLLREYTNDKDLWPLIGEGSNALSPEEEAVLSVYRKVVECDPSMREHMASSASLYASSCNIDLSYEIGMLKRERPLIKRR
jgi:hypothetical protein